MHIAVRCILLRARGPEGCYPGFSPIEHAPQNAPKIDGFGDMM